MKNYLMDALEINQGDLVTLVGGGGKTSTQNRLAQELAKVKKQVILTTTTKIFPPQGFNHRLFLLAEGSQLKKPEQLDQGSQSAREKPFILESLQLEKGDILVLGKCINSSGKIVGLNLAEMKIVKSLYPRAVIIVEGDGANQKPFKAHGSQEPVIPSETSMVVPVVGIDGLDKPLNELYFHRVKELRAITGLKKDRIFGAEEMAHVLLHQKGFLKEVPRGARWVPLINKVDLPDGRKKALQLITILKKQGVEKIILASLGIANSPVEVF